MKFSTAAITILTAAVAVPEAQAVRGSSRNHNHLERRLDKNSPVEECPFTMDGDAVNEDFIAAFCVGTTVPASKSKKKSSVALASCGAVRAITADDSCGEDEITVPVVTPTVPVIVVGAVAGTIEVPGSSAGDTENESQTSTCPEGKVAVGINGEDKSVTGNPRAFQLRCATVSLTGSRALDGTYLYEFSDFQNADDFIQDGNKTPDENLPCQDGYLLSGLARTGRGGPEIDGFRALCTHPTTGDQKTDDGIGKDFTTGITIECPAGQYVVGAEGAGIDGNTALSRLVLECAPVTFEMVAPPQGILAAVVPL